MSRYRHLTVYAAIGAGLAVMFAVFIAFRRDTALIAALSAAGTVAAGAFAAIAAAGSMRAAAEAGATARRTREVLARAGQPAMVAELTETGGVVRCVGSRAAIDVMSVWMFDGHEAISERVARLEPGGELPVPFPPAAALELLWIEYADDTNAGQWQDTWKPAAGRLIRTDASLVD